MRVLILADRSFARREQAMLARLEVGLADEGVQVVHAVPAGPGGLMGLGTDGDLGGLGGSGSVFGGGSSGAGAALGGGRSGGDDGLGLYSTRVGYADGGLRLTVRPRARALIGAIRDSLPEHLAPGIDVVHVFGTEAWAMGGEVARLANARLVLELWRSASIGEASGLAGVSGKPVGTADLSVPTFLVSEPSVEAGLRKRSARAVVRRAPWGVHAAGTLRPAYAAGHDAGSSSPSSKAPLAITILADTGDVASTLAVLAGIAQACGIGSKAASPEVSPAASPADPLIFLGTEDGVASREAAIWAGARNLGLLDRLTLLDDMEARREPILQTDLLILPEASGRQRTLALEAMATGIPVLAAADPYVDSLIDGVTARLVSTPTAGAWAAALTKLLSSHDDRQRLAVSAHAYIKANRSAAGQVSAVLAAYGVGLS